MPCVLVAPSPMGNVKRMGVAASNTTQQTSLRVLPRTLHMRVKGPRFVARVRGRGIGNTTDWPRMATRRPDNENQEGVSCSR